MWAAAAGLTPSSLSRTVPLSVGHNVIFLRDDERFLPTPRCACCTHHTRANHQASAGPGTLRAALSPLVLPDSLHASCSSDLSLR